MAFQTLQVTIAATGVAQQISPRNRMLQWFCVQNNSTHGLRVGDVSVSATRGFFVPGSATAPGEFEPNYSLEYAVRLEEIWICGTAGDVIDVLFIE